MNTFTTLNISSLRSFADPYMSALSSGVQSAGQAASGAARQGYAIAHTTLKAMGENIGTGFTSLKTTVVNNASSLAANTTQALETAAAFGTRTIQQIPTAFNQASQTAALTFKAMGDRSTRIGQNTVIARNIVVVCSIVSLIAYGIFRWISYTNTLKAQLATATAERDAAQTQRDALQGQLANAEARIAQMETTSTSNRAALDLAERELTRIQAECEALRAQSTTSREATAHASDETTPQLVQSFIHTLGQQQPISGAAAGMLDETTTSPFAPASFVAILPSASLRTHPELSQSGIAHTSTHSVTSLGGTPRIPSFSQSVVGRHEKAVELHVSRIARASAASGLHTLLRSRTAALSPRDQQGLVQAYQGATRVNGSPASNSKSGVTQAAQRALRSPSATVTRR